MKCVLTYVILGLQGLLLSLACAEDGDTALFLWSFVNKNIVLSDKMELSREKLVS